jgi:hypothetical protein
MNNYYKLGDSIICVETCHAGHGSMTIGIGDSYREAMGDLQSTPIEGHLDPSDGLRWAITAGWFGDGAELELELEMLEESSPFEPDACTDHSSAEDMYDALGWHTTDGEDQVVHPVCPMSDVESYEPESELEEEAIEYARQAAVDMTAVAESLEEAVSAYVAEDYEACLDALRSASQAEGEYGDDPETRALADALLRDGANALQRGTK